MPESIARHPRGSSFAAVIPSTVGLETASDDDLLARLRAADEVARAAASVKAEIAGEIARRSTVAAGHTGLAARLGERSAEKLIQRLTGSTAGEAKHLTETGALLRSTRTGQTPWLDSVAAAVVEGELSVSGAAAVAKGLGEPTATVSAGDLAELTADLVRFAATATPEEAAARARAERDAIDNAGVADRERMLRARRSCTSRRLDDGRTRYILDCDPESAAIIDSVIEPAFQAARGRGGVQFMTATEREALTGDSIDDRTADQVRFDTFIDVMLLAQRAAGSELDSARIFGGRTTGVRVHVQATDLQAGVGVGFLEGQSVGVSIETVTRMICTSGILPVLFDGNRPIDAGRTQRLHSTRQRIALAAAWGGCAWTNCDRPPRDCEVHHPERWNGSNTTLVNGVPFCRFHHVEFHANGWSLTFDPDGSVWLEPPPGETGIVRVALRSKSPLHRAA